MNCHIMSFNRRGARPLCQMKCNELADGSGSDGSMSLLTQICDFQEKSHTVHSAQNLTNGCWAWESTCLRQSQAFMLTMGSWPLHTFTDAESEQKPIFLEWKRQHQWPDWSSVPDNTRWLRHPCGELEWEHWGQCRICAKLLYTVPTHQQQVSPWGESYSLF